MILSTICMRNFEESTLFHIGHMLRHLAKLIKKEFGVEEIPLTGEQFGLLSIIAEKDEFIQSDLAAMFDKDKSAILRQIDILEKLQLIVRKNDETDRRKKFLRVTPEGISLLNKCRAVINEIMVGMEAGIAEEDRKVFRKVLLKMKENADTAVKQSEIQS